MYERTKRAAFSAPVVRSAVRRRRAQRVEASYHVIREHYERLGSPPPAGELLAKRAGERLKRFQALDRSPRVLFVGTVLEQDGAGILAGLQRVSEVTSFTQADGSYGQFPGGIQSFDHANANGARLLELLDERAAAGAHIDIVIGQMWGGYMPPAALDEARRRHGVLVVNIGMDDRHTFELRKLGRELGTKLLAPAVDLVGTSAPEAATWFRHEGCAAIFWPEASDAQLFHPGAGERKAHDVCFVGGNYGIRGEIVARLEQAGLRVEARGAGWPGGPVPIEDVPRLFAESRLVLGIGTVGHSRSLLALKLRDFDGPMSGSCYVTHDNSDLGLVYEVGSEIAVYRNEQEVVDVVRALLEDDRRRESVARAGRARAARDHTWERRFGDLLAVLRGEIEI